MNNALVACLMLALSLNAADSMAASSRSRSDYSRHQKASHEVNAQRPVKQSAHSKSGKNAHAQQVFSQSAQASGKAGPGLKFPTPEKFIIAIDAGHGGKDTGAIGLNGTLEKDVVYAIARKLEKLIRAEPGMAAVMVRRRDNFIALPRRAQIARNAGADLFVSLHADAYGGDDAKGSSVFTRLVRRSEYDDFSKNTLRASNRAAGKILVEMRKKQPLHFRHVKRARFAVLKSPDVPSTLIETGFISNPDEEKKLASPAYQEKVAQSVFEGVRAYFRATGHLRVKTASARPFVVASRQ